MFCRWTPPAYGTRFCVSQGDVSSVSGTFGCFVGGRRQRVSDLSVFRGGTPPEYGGRFGIL